MRPPAQIKDWLTLEAMFRWVQDAPDQAAYKSRMAVWLTHTGNMHAGEVARILGVSQQAVWLWIRQYNAQGPDGLERGGRGGRRWGLMTPEQEAEFLRPIIRRARAGHAPKPEAIKQMLEDELHRKVSKSYVYKLLRRYGWADILRRSRSPAEDGDSFGKFAKPWLRDV